MGLLENTIVSIGELDRSVMQEACSRQSSLTKPVGSLGILEDIAIKLAGITGTVCPAINNKTIVTMAGDHGVVAEGVSAYPQEVTGQMVANIVAGGAAINVLARHAGAKVVVVDLGIADRQHFGAINRKIKAGTDNMVHGPAMTRDEARASLEAGIEIVLREIDSGARIIGTGDMGIGNTTPSSAILASLAGLPADMTVGRGTGINDQGWQRKVEAVARAIQVNIPDPSDAVDVLAKVGGLEIGGLAGVILGAASRRVPVLVDGFISGAAALIAARIEPRCRNFMLASHLSVEPGHKIMLDMLELEPILKMNLRLGEGTGAALVMPILDAAVKIMKEMATFDSAGVSEKSD